MSLYVASIASGSNGNCYYVGNDTEAVLIDAGISCREIERRMHRLGLNLQKVKAIFISHEHSDHISGVAVLSKKYSLPVYVSSATYHHCRRIADEERAVHFTAGVPVYVGTLQVKAFRKFHDAADPHSFVISHQATTVGVFTDIGRACTAVKDHISVCHAVFLEANYDEEMLKKGNYPWHLKKRISGGLGHLSNRQALDLLMTHGTHQLSHVFLTHLSKNNNCPMLVQELFAPYSRERTFVLASREKETEVYHIRGGPQTKIISTGPVVQQLTLDLGG